MDSYFVVILPSVEVHTATCRDLRRPGQGETSRVTVKAQDATAAAAKVTTDPAHPAPCTR